MSSPGDSSLALCPVTCFFPGIKALCRVRLPPQTDDFVHQKKATSSFQNIPCLLLSASGFLNQKKIQSVPLPGFRSSHCSCREEVPVQVEQVFPNSQHPIPAGALAAGSRTHIKTSKHRLYVATSGFSRATRPAPAADTVRKSPSPALGTAATGETEPGSSELTFTQVCCLLQGFECSPAPEKLQTPK